MWKNLPRPVLPIAGIILFVGIVLGLGELSEWLSKRGKETVAAAPAAMSEEPAEEETEIDSQVECLHLFLS